MYNRYLQEAQPAEAESAAAHTEKAAPAGGLLSGLTQRIGNFRIDADTLIMLAVIWFVLSESGEDMEHELLIAIAVLMLLGV